MAFNYSSIDFFIVSLLNLPMLVRICHYNQATRRTRQNRKVFGCYGCGLFLGRDSPGKR